MTRAPNRSLGEAALLSDAERPGGWLLTVDRVRQSYVDLEDPTFLDFGYVQDFARVLDALPDGRLAVTHVGGGACTFARYIAVTRPGSPQIVLEPDTELTALVRARLPLPTGHRIRIRAIEGRAGVAALRDASADVVVLDAFHGGRIPGQLTTREFFADIARVLRPDGVLLANIADGPPLTYSTTGRRGGAHRAARRAGDHRVRRAEVAPLRQPRRRRVARRTADRRGPQGLRACCVPARGRRLRTGTPRSR